MSNLSRISSTVWRRRHAIRCACRASAILCAFDASLIRLESSKQPLADNKAGDRATIMKSAKKPILAFTIGLALASPVAAGERTTPSEASLRTSFASTGARPQSALDRVTYAIDGAESSHGRNAAMWRTDQSGPQGPMQVSEMAATDVGGGDRFDLTQNRAIGRLYLARLHGHYKNWPDAIAAYNWGRGNVDAWIKAGRPNQKLLPGVAAYLTRVLHDSGVCSDPEALPFPRISGDPDSLMIGSADALVIGKDRIGAACSHLDTRGDPWEGSHQYSRDGLSLIDRRTADRLRSLYERTVASARLSWIMATQHLGCSGLSSNALQCR
jgi:Transglycosylase SLT domain